MQQSTCSLLTILGSTLILSACTGAHGSPAPATTDNATTASSERMFQAEFSDSGALRRPALDYRRWVHAGTPLTPHDMNDGKAAFPEFHAVYVNPAALTAYEKTGKWPAGTAIVKELVSVGTKQAESGNGYFMGEFTGLEVMLKDPVRFPKSPGNWAFFSFGHSYPLADSATPQPDETCAGCHDASADDDLVFTQYYPLLRAARQGKAM